ncbi:endolytic transglycosylase MltG [Fulvivirga lutea]|uniref:Endolytic murein transglycosylase n=1 Tax=Fulvivirga lutea TaxID=2810512 RepID=A0A974WHJ6_9BACT|nr:endolytic transglycosylase MltG [Fulvivirga lutea]QSE97853.1 endolytic transglycosylase MltG [Fulvivirga lutea]
MNNKKFVVVFMLVGTILLSSFSFYAYQMVFSPNFLVEGEKKILFIEKNETFKSLQNKLYDQNYVNDLVSFSFLAKIMDYDTSIKPGRYAIQPNMSNIDVIRLLRTGTQTPVRITFNNIRLKEGLAPKLTENLLMNEKEFNEAMDRFVKSNDEFNEHTIISMFIPNTYEVYYNISGDDLMKRMHKEFKNFWNDTRLAKAKELGMSPTEIMTLASIVHAESVKKSEGKTIAGLYINRLQKRIPLQADPTLVFAAKDFTIKRVLNVHKEIDSPFNTYKNAGLPPGPINMPPIHAIDAVLNYEKHNYIYMCAKEDFSGYHYFAETLREHINNANKYQRQLSIEQRKARMNNN